MKIKKELIKCKKCARSADNKSDDPSLPLWVDKRTKLCNYCSRDKK